MLPVSPEKLMSRGWKVVVDGQQLTHAGMVELVSERHGRVGSPLGKFVRVGKLHQQFLLEPDKQAVPVAWPVLPK